MLNEVSVLVLFCDVALISSDECRWRHHPEDRLKTIEIMFLACHA